MRPKVSIIVPVYKTKETLAKCVNSLFGTDTSGNRGNLS